MFARLALAFEDVGGDPALLELLAELQAHEAARRVARYAKVVLVLDVADQVHVLIDDRIVGREGIVVVILPIEDTAPSTAVTVQAPSGVVAATVAPLAFYDRDWAA
jgi:hypothetical protein